MDNVRPRPTSAQGGARLRNAVAIFLLAFLPRLFSLGADLPRFYFPDEPHHLNLAAHYGTGDLNPHDFKYPTFWTYLLAMMLGCLYLAGRFLGLVDSAAHYAVLFVNQPTVFYLAARLLACALFASGAAMLTYAAFSTEGKTRLARGAGLLLALSPSLAIYGREATPYCLLVACVAGAIVFSERLLNAVSLRDALAAGAFTAGAASSHYLGATIATLPLLAIFLSATRGARARTLGAFVAGGVLLFAATSPFVLLDWKNAMADVFSIGDLQTPTGSGGLFSLERNIDILKNVLMFLDPLGIGFVLVFTGAVTARPGERVRRWIWFAPFLILLPLLLVSHFGALPRYSLAVLVPLVVPASYGWETILDRLPSAKLRAAFSAMVFVVYAAGSLVPGCRATAPDTRTLAEKWILEHVPSGQKIFVTDPFLCPQLSMTRAQLIRLRDRCAAIGHPRAQYYQLKLAGNAADGYEIYQLRRSHAETQDIPRRDDYAYLAVDWLDPQQGGLSVLTQAGVDVVVLQSQISAETHPWISELRAATPPAARFSLDAGGRRGPALEIYRLPAPKEKS